MKGTEGERPGAEVGSESVVPMNKATLSPAKPGVSDPRARDVLGESNVRLAPWRPENPQALGRGRLPKLTGPQARSGAMLT